MLRNGLLRYILHTCPLLWLNPLDCFHTYVRHVQSCDVTRVQSATEWTRSGHTSHMSKAVMEPVFKVLLSGLLPYILPHVQSCDVTRVQSAMEWTCSVHTSHMSKAVMKPVFKGLRSGLLRYILHMSKVVMQPVQSATAWTASVRISHMSKAEI